MFPIKTRTPSLQPIGGQKYWSSVTSSHHGIVPLYRYMTEAAHKHHLFVIKGAGEVGYIINNLKIVSPKENNDNDWKLYHLTTTK